MEVKWTANQVVELYARVAQLEKLVQYPNSIHYPPTDEGLNKLNMAQQAAQIEATKDLYAPLRTNVDPLAKLAAFARRLLDPHDLGPAVSFEVRELAREALGKEKQG